MISAAEDIGLANPNALLLATSCAETLERIGWPEGRIPLAETVIYLACSEKSNSAYMAINRALSFVKQTGNLPVPLHLRNAPTELMKDLGYGEDTATRTTTQGTSYSKPTSPRASGGSASGSRTSPTVPRRR